MFLIFPLGCFLKLKLCHQSSFRARIFSSSSRPPTLIKQQTSFIQQTLWGYVVLAVQSVLTRHVLESHECIWWSVSLSMAKKTSDVGSFGCTFGGGGGGSILKLVWPCSVCLQFFAHVHLSGWDDLVSLNLIFTDIDGIGLWKCLRYLPTCVIMSCCELGPSTARAPDPVFEMVSPAREKTISHCFPFNNFRWVIDCS